MSGFVVDEYARLELLGMRRVHPRHTNRVLDGKSRLEGIVFD
jgi:hypothetical protein